MADSFFSALTDSLGYEVQLGVWTNWSRGPVFGATLTLDRRQGSLFISFTAFFVTIVAARFWRVACSIIHRKLSVAEPRDAFHYQRQAIFRNSASSESALWSFMQISWAWRHLTQRNLGRMLPSISFAAVCLLVFAFASGFSSSISTAIGDEVLIDGSHCGYLDFNILDPNDNAQIFEPWQASSITNAANYAAQVYSPSNTGVFSSTVFVQPRINTKSNNKAPCPFHNLLCRSNSSNLFLDSGYVDTRRDLGLNLRPEQSMLYRQTLHCAPLVTEGHKEKTNYGGFPNYTSYNYGVAKFSIPTEESVNSTFTIKDIESQYSLPSSSHESPTYSLSTFRSFMVNGTSYGESFVAGPGLERLDADTYLIFLSGNGVISSVPLNDPWYRFDIKTRSRIVELSSQPSSNESAPAYQPSEAASPLGCAYQCQICKGNLASNKSCGPLGSYNDAWIGAATLFGVNKEDFFSSGIDQLIEAYAVNEEASRFLWLVDMIDNSPTDITNSISNLGAQSLESSRGLAHGIQGPLPDDQWKLDVAYWWNMTFASLQAAFVDTAYGSTTPDVLRLQRNVTNVGQNSTCWNQKIRSTQYISISVFGLYFTYITGFLIIVLSFVIDPLLSFAQKRWKYREYENLEWISNETLQLQRLAYDESGQGEWSKCTDYVPVTTPDQRLGSLNLNDLEHPRLNRPRSPRSSKEISMPSSIIQGTDGNEENCERIGDENSHGLGPLARPSQ